MFLSSSVHILIFRRGTWASSLADDTSPLSAYNSVLYEWIYCISFAMLTNKFIVLSSSFLNLSNSKSTYILLCPTILVPISQFLWDHYLASIIYIYFSHVPITSDVLHFLVILKTFVVHLHSICNLNFWSYRGPLNGSAVVLRSSRRVYERGL